MERKVFSSLEEEEISKLSVESTDEEQYSSDHEYTVERILAQKSEDGQQLYLIRKARRDRLRREKRKRQGIVVSPHESDADDGERQSKIPCTRVSKAKLDGGERSFERRQEVRATKKSKVQEREPLDSDSSSEEPLFVNPRRKMTTGASSSTKVPQALKEPQKLVTLQETTSDKRETPSKEASSAVGGIPKPPEEATMRGRKAELAGRALADAAPDLTALGGLIIPSEASSVRRLETVRRTFSATQNEDGNNQTISSARPPHEQLEDSRRLPENPLHVSERPWAEVQHIPYEQRSICFFHSRPQGCLNRNQCKYLHVDDPLLPIAPPPDGWAESQKICFFYNLDGNCRKGDTCSYLHESGTGFPVCKPPPGWVASKPPAKVMPKEAQMTSENTVSREAQIMPDDTVPGEAQMVSENDSRSVVYTGQVQSNIAEVEISSGATLHPSQQKSKSKVLGEDETIHFEMDTAPDLPPLETNLAESAPSNFDHCPRDKMVQSTRTAVKTVTIVSEAQPISLGFTSFPLDASDLTRAFASTETVKFDQLCTAQDFKLRYCEIQNTAYWQQDIDTSITDKAGCDIVNRVVQYLCLRKAGLVCISDTYIILLYPAKIEEWKYLDVLPDFSSNAELKYLVFSFKGPVPNFIESSTINQTSSKDLTHRDMMMKSFHHLDFERLTLEQKSKKVINFCLIFPESANPIAESITLWLRSCSKDSKIYNYQKPGSWDHFKKHAKAGVVLIHLSAICLISDTDLIRDMTAGLNFTFWSIEDFKCIVPFSFSRYYKVSKPELGQIVTRQLLPLGYAILLTPSFCVAEPVMTLKFLRWYQKKLKSTISGSIRVLCCHEILRFLKELFVSKVAEQQRFMKSHINDPVLLAKLDAKGLSQEQCAARIDIYWLLRDMISKDLPSHLSPIDRDPSAETSQSPFFFAPSWIDQNDEKMLVSWFTGWAYCNLDKYRKFYVIGSGRSKKNVDVPVKLDEFEFQFTDEWYPKWREYDPEGQSSNHIIVNRWDQVFKSLNIPY
ncbi:hypothetical protein EYC84_001730 [Monilinia fructicola]|uniref:C3H1-type domain-containing protein n=1 Tax=Monilinia fructicola TaxID=38448 RepID=A0A5M9JYF3_MONFR|nr:hypothetical protein EYC84_001730 [Monilinia fructicola]